MKKFLAAMVLMIGVNMSAQVLSSQQALELSKKYLAEFSKGETDDLWQHMTPAMQAALKDPATWKTMPAQFKSQLGEETTVENECMIPAPRLQVYTRLSEFASVPGKFITTIALDDEARIAGFSIRPMPNPAESKYLDYKDKTKFHLPFKGTWIILQGGRTTYENYHAAYPDERFAYDIVGVKDGKIYSGDADKPESFFGFGQPVLAPADGTVVTAVDRYDDNPVGKRSATNPKEGNTVVIDQGNGEFSMIAHLKSGSVKVKVGDKVKVGQAIGQCGNSGNSDLPHVHYHVQTTKDWFKGDGLPIEFVDYVADGKPVASGEPERGQTVQPK
jgi:Peptidase family M23